MNDTPFQQLIATHSLSIQAAHDFMYWISLLGGFSVHQFELSVLQELYVEYQESTNDRKS